MTAPNFPSQSGYQPSNVAALDSWLIGDGKYVWVLKVTPVLLSTSTPTTLYFSTDIYRDQDSPPRLVLPSVALSIVNGNFGVNAGDGETIDYNQFRAGQMSYGGFSILNHDGEYDSLVTDYAWGDAACELQFGEAGGTVDTFMVFKVRDEPTYDNDKITFAVKGAILNPNGPVQTDTFASGDMSAALEDVLVGKSRPVLIGKVDNVSPTEVDHSTLKFEIDNRGIDAVSEVYEGGYPVGSAGYTETIGTGTFVLTNQPVSGNQITADVVGDGTTYYLSENFAGLAETIGGSAAPATAGLDDVGGIFIGSGKAMRFEEALTWSIRPLGVYFPAQDGSKLLAGEIGAPEDGVSALTLDDSHISNVRRQVGAPPAWQVRVGYRPLGTVLSSWVGGIDQDEVVRLTEPQRFEVAEDATVLTDYPNALSIEVTSSLYEKTAATAAATLLLATLKVKRDLYKVDLVRKPFAAWLGEIVTVEYPRYGLDAGKQLMVVGWSVDLNSKKFTLEAWG